MVAMAFKFSHALSPSEVAYLHNGGHGRSTTEVLDHFSSTPPDFLHGFDDAMALGTDRGPNGLTLTNTFAVGPIQATGPG
jgi:hypothetical protein